MASNTCDFIDLSHKLNKKGSDFLYISKVSCWILFSKIIRTFKILYML